MGRARATPRRPGLRPGSAVSPARLSPQARRGPRGRRASPRPRRARPPEPRRRGRRRPVARDGQVRKRLRPSPARVDGLGRAPRAPRITRTPRTCSHDRLRRGAGSEPRRAARGGPRALTRGSRGNNLKYYEESGGSPHRPPATRPHRVSESEEKTRVTAIVQKPLGGTEGAPKGNDCLVVIYTKEPTLLGKRFVLEPSPMRVGRGADNHIVLDGDCVSRRHAHFEQRSGAWWCVDDGSTNGTYVNDEQITREVAPRQRRPHQDRADDLQVPVRAGRRGAVPRRDLPDDHHRWSHAGPREALPARGARARRSSARAATSAISRS